ncbi:MULTISPECIES: DUF4352 domain-containing protein [Streptomyces]|uniref:DUF4352 domain-containing protein n=1 Tax=Streptomyces rubiginosohelvolus TaxID=67362 RepID=A0ABQ3C4Q8_9ACTN|nr:MULTISPECIES: DUF4352 domain-containing protein [Streptomyces]RUP65861.1 Telomeric repeat-binding factor 2 [Streptomyces sp. NP10]WST52075.1 DUF4352 domain-containing protein [Streptomyces rubiginosohelvolus]GGR93433.1 hypothetical protein GCM10010284_28080 [Streptomyces rubiginosohelvolus]GGZ68150.1 hypothetical protein GCM10010328_49190 [Streptomyces pluricolorescens]
MTYQQPQPGQPQQPGWGQQPPPPRKRKTGKIIGFGCLGVVGLIVLIVVIAMVASGGDDGNESSTTNPSATQGEAKKDEPKEEESAEKAPVTVTAKAVAFKKSVLAQGDDYTSVQVTITNNSKNDIEVNPLYVTITDTDGSKHTVELGVDEDPLDAVTLSPGENVTGTVTAKGTFDAKYVTYTDGLIGDSVRGDVS